MFYFYTVDNIQPGGFNEYYGNRLGDGMISYKRPDIQGRIWEMPVDKSHYNLLYFYNQIGRSSLEGKKTDVMLLLDKITQKLIFDNRYYEHLVNEITTFEKVYPFEKPLKKVYFLKKDYFEAALALERILNQEEIFFNRLILNQQLRLPMLRAYFMTVLFATRIFGYEIEWYYYIRRCRPPKGRFIRPHRMELLYNRKERKVKYFKLRLRPEAPEYLFDYFNSEVKNMRTLINELYDPTGTIHLEAIDILFNGHIKDVQIARYYQIYDRSSSFYRKYYERFFSEIIYGYNINQNAIWNVLKTDDYERYYKLYRIYTDNYLRPHFKLRRKEYARHLRRLGTGNGNDDPGPIDIGFTMKDI